MLIIRMTIRKKGKLFEDPETVIRRHLEEALTEVAAFGEREIRKRTPAGATGNLHSRILGEVRVSPQPAVLWGTPAAYGPAVEEGRRPGRMPPPEALVSWVEEVLNVPREKSRGVAFVVARAIGRRGTKPRGMFGRSLEPIRRFALRTLERRIRRIADDLNR